MSLVRRQLTALFAAEVRLLSRNSAVTATATIFPIAVAAVLVYFGKRSPGPLGWSFPLALQLILMFGMTVYMTSTLTLTARREDLYLKRLRSGEAADTTILVGVLSPVIVLGVLQCLLVVAIVWAFGPAVPANPLLLALAILLGVAMSAALGIATTGLVSGTQQADMAALPFFLFLTGTGIWAGMQGADGPGLAQTVLPGGAVVETVRLAYDHEATLGAQFVGALPALAALVGWTAFGTLAGRRFFRWDRRG